MNERIENILFEESYSGVIFAVVVAVALPAIPILSYAGGRRLHLQFWDNPRLFLIGMLCFVIALLFTGVRGKIIVTLTHVIVRSRRKETAIAKTDILWAIVPKRFSGTGRRGALLPRAWYDAPSGPTTVRVEMQPRMYVLSLVAAFMMKGILLARRDGSYVLIPTKRPEELLRALNVSSTPTF